MMQVSQQPIATHRHATGRVSVLLCKCFAADSICALAVLVLLAWGPYTADAAITPTGDINPAYDATDPWVVGGNLYVGNSSTGTLEIDSASVVNNAVGYLGYDTGSNGTATVTDPGSAWNNTSDLNVGWYGSATLTIQSGGMVSNAIANLNTYNSPHVTATVTGTGSAWHNTGRMNVGLSGTATLNVENGGAVDSPSGLVGASSISYGTANVTGAGSAWVNSAGMTLGLSGSGTLNITNGGMVSNTYAVFANNLGASGSATISGHGSLWNNSSEMTLGRFGTGTLNIEDGGEVSNTTCYLGYYNSTGAATVAGAGSLWNNTGVLNVGFGGTGILNITSGGTVNAGNGMILGTYSFGNGTVNLSGGTLDLNGTSITAGDGPAAFNFSGGKIKDAGTIDLKHAFVQTGGTLAPGGSIGQTSIVGDYDLTGGTVEIELGGTGNPFDLLTTTGDIDIAILGTTLDLQGIGMMQAGTYTIIESLNGSLTGEFEHITGLGEIPGLVDVTYTSNAVLVTLNADYIPEPGMMVLFATGLLCGCGQHRRS